MQLSPNFSLEELTATSTGLDNTPTPAQVQILTTLAVFLEKIRERALRNNPILVDDAYRSPAVNAADGGAHNSAHELCFAADIVCPKFGDAFKVAMAIQQATSAGELRYDQLIYEQSPDGRAQDWVHVSRDPRLRGQALTKLVDGAYVGGLVPRS